ncbi:MAG TPA: hypothetical protein VFV07_10245 [Rhizomicrobium sp.]|nr:hypothetical protein [Rhizomicrobium sp.]
MVSYVQTFMGANVQEEVNKLLAKAGRLRHAALATSMRHYRALLLKVARELEAKAAALEIDAERQLN